MPTPIPNDEQALGEAFEKFRDTTSRNAERSIRESDGAFRLTIRVLLLLNGAAAIITLAHLARVSSIAETRSALWAIGYLAVGAAMAIVARLAKNSSLRHQMLEFAQANSKRIRGYIEASGGNPDDLGFEDGDVEIHRAQKSKQALLARVLVAASISLFLAASTITFYGISGS